MNRGSQVETVSLAHAKFKVIECLKNREAKTGLTQLQLEKKTNLNLDERMVNFLKESDNIEYNEKSKKFSYKFLHELNNKDQLLQLLGPKNPPILVDDDILKSSYEGIEGDIEELHDEMLLLKVRNTASKNDVLYPVQFAIPEEVYVVRPEEEIRQLWHNVKTGDYTQLRNVVRDSGIGTLSQLDINILPEEFRRKMFKEKGQRTVKKKVKKEKTSHERQLSEVAYAARHLFTDLNVNPNKTLKIEDEDSDDEEDEKKRASFLVHNIEANMQEYELLSELMNIIGCWFYEDVHILVFQSFLKQKVYKETDFAKLVLLPPRQISSSMQQLNNHHLLNKVSCESAAGQGAGVRSFTLWQMDLDKFVNSVWYHVIKIKENLKAVMDKIGSEILECQECTTRFGELDVIKLRSELDGKYYCKHCEDELLITIDNDEEKEKQRLLSEKVSAILEPIIEKLKEIHDAGDLELRGNRFVQPLRKPTPRGALTGPKATVTKKSTLFDSTHRPKVEQKNSNIPDTVVDNGLDFNPTPIVLTSTNLVYLKIETQPESVMKQTGYRLAKQLLNEIAEFKYILQGKVYVFEITEQSLYLAWANGYTGKSVMRLLTTLSACNMPSSLARLIMTYTNEKKYYRAIVTLKPAPMKTNFLDTNPSNVVKLRHCIQSTSKEVLANLMNSIEIRDRLMGNANELEEVVSGDVTTYNFGIRPGENENLKKAAFQLGFPMIDRYNFLSTVDSPFPISLRDSSNVRDYQRAAINSIFWKNDFGQLAAHSGVLVLPCGGGKTLIGVGIIAAVKKPTIIFCQSNLALAQWKDQILKWTHMGTNLVSRFSSEYQNEWDPRAPIIVTTYHMFSSREGNRSSKSQDMMTKCKAREWGICVLDEVHLAPAKIFRTVTNSINCHIKIGLTATMVREDELVTEIPFLVGPTLFNLDIFTLRTFNHIAPVECTEITIPLTEVFGEKFFVEDDSQVRTMLWTCNPNKLRVVYELMQKHVKENNKVMVFCDNLFALHVYQEILRCPKIEGSTPTAERLQIIKKFKEVGGNCVLFSTVGDQSIDLPEADVVIQLALTDGSRMQEGQRIGRVQRSYRDKKKAFFYSLISDATEEFNYAQKRRMFLHENGYTVTQIPYSDDSPKSSVDKFSFLTEAWEHNLITAIHNEIQTRGDKKIAKLTGFDQIETLKRQRPQSTTSEINKIAKKAKQNNKL
jgi:DNA repair helicase Rad25